MGHVGIEQGLIDRCLQYVEDREEQALPAGVAEQLDLDIITTKTRLASFVRNQFDRYEDRI